MNIKSNLLQLVLCITFVMLASVTNAQPPNEGENLTESGNVVSKSPRDNFYDRHIYKEKRSLAYDFIHEKDVFWEKRIWRVIDTREKMNLPFRYEKYPFISLIIDAAQNEDIKLYSTFDDEFKVEMTKEEVQQITTSTDTIITFDPETFQEIVQVVENPLNPEDIKSYRLKEVWFFDEEASQLEVRILGIAPIVNRYDEDGNFLNSGPMFWAYYPELRYVLARHEAFNEKNDAARMSWDNIFEARLFSSYIYKESNIHDRRIQDYRAGIDILLESEKIKQEIFNFEHDLWSY